MLDQRADDDQASNSSAYPVDSTTRTYRQSIGRHTPNCHDLDKTCASWCTDHAKADPACWGADRYVNLTMEDGYPHGALPGMAAYFDPPRIGVNPYRQKPGWRSVAYLHLYRPSDNPHRDIDRNLQVTSEEARRLAYDLIEVADILDGAR